LVFTIVHMAALVGDNFVHFGLTDLLVPLASDWNPGAVAWGIVTMYLLVAVEVTSLLMKRIPRRWWKMVHFGSYGLLWTGLIHGSTAGTDSSSGIYVLAMGLIILLTMGLTAYRILVSRLVKKALAA